MARLNERHLARMIAGLITRITGRRSNMVLVAATVVVALLMTMAPDWLGQQDGPGRKPTGDDRSYWSYTLPDLKTVAAGDQSCPVFFDRDPDSLAMPAPPPVTAFGAAVLRACGPLGGRVSEAEFEALIGDHYETVSRILPAAWRKLPQDDVLARLKQAWLTHQGFDHVFCGEWKNDTIGGLHYRGRFLQLQAEGSACLLPSDKQEIEPGQIYSIGVVSADKRHRHPIKGYALNQSALDLLRLGTGTLAQCCQAGGGGWENYRNWVSKVQRVTSDEGGVEISNRVICRADNPNDAGSIGLVTLYSDATPDRRTPICRLP